MRLTGSNVMMRKLLAAITGLLLLACITVEARDLEDRKWIEVSTPEFRVYSVMSEKKTVDLVRNLDMLRKVVPVITGLPRTDSVIPTEIFAVKNSGDFELFGLDRNYAGYFRGGLRNNTILIRDTPDMDEAGIILHEYAQSCTNMRTSCSATTERSITRCGSTKAMPSI